MLLFKIFWVTFSIFVLSRIYKKYKDNSIKINTAIFWSIFWLGAIIVVLKTEFTSQLAKLVGIGRGVDLVVYVSLIFLFYIIFHIINRLEKIESNLTKIARSVALGENKNFKDKI